MNCMCENGRPLCARIDNESGNQGDESVRIVCLYVLLDKFRGKVEGESGLCVSVY